MVLIIEPWFLFEVLYIGLFLKIMLGCYILLLICNGILKLETKPTLMGPECHSEFFLIHVMMYILQVKVSFKTWAFFQKWQDNVIAEHMWILLALMIGSYN